MANQARRSRRRIINIPTEYLEAIDHGNSVFPSLYQLENGLRLVINDFLVTCYGKDWWENSLKSRLPVIYMYAANQRKKNDSMPWLGNSKKVEVLPIHLTTIGQLEEIIKHYKSDCIPELFPSLDFFSGHMEIIKRVRNFYAHMFPCVTKQDCIAAKREIAILRIPLNQKLRY